MHLILDSLLCSRLVIPQRTLKDTFILRCSSQCDAYLLLFEIDFIQALDGGGAVRLSGLSVRQLRCKTEYLIDPFSFFMALYKDYCIVLLLFHFWYEASRLKGFSVCSDCAVWIHAKSVVDGRVYARKHKLSYKLSYFYNDKCISSPRKVKHNRLPASLSHAPVFVLSTEHLWEE